MSSDTNAAETVSARHIVQALAALREAAEHLEDVAAASETPVLSVESALSHVAAARTALRPRGFGVIAGALERDVA